MTVTVFEALAEAACPHCEADVGVPCSGLPQSVVHARRMVVAERQRMLERVAEAVEAMEDYFMLLATTARG